MAISEISCPIKARHSSLPKHTIFAFNFVLYSVIYVFLGSLCFVREELVP
jgi:hypothetical protein